MPRPLLTALLSCFLCVSCDASYFLFQGSDEGGTGSGTLEFVGLGTTSLTVKVNNTSPLTLDNGTGVNAPGITGFGFDAKDPVPTVNSWNLVAVDKDTGNTVQIDDQSGGTGDWRMANKTQGIELDFLPTIEDVKGALYNPKQTDGFASEPNYFTEAVLTIIFQQAFDLGVHGTGQGGVDASPLMRLKNVGLGGRGSLKLAGTPGSPGSPGPGTTPEPTTLAIWSLLGGLGIIGWWRRRKRA